MPMPYLAPVWRSHVFWHLSNITEHGITLCHIDRGCPTLMVATDWCMPAHLRGGAWDIMRRTTRAVCLHTPPAFSRAALRSAPVWAHRGGGSGAPRLRMGCGGEPCSPQACAVLACVPHTAPHHPPMGLSCAPLPRAMACVFVQHACLHAYGA